jgi:cytidylate kinase
VTGAPAPVIAIDGPTASGKGTVAQRVAAALGWHYLDSGSLYRLTALGVMRGLAGAAAQASLAEPASPGAARAATGCASVADSAGASGAFDASGAPGAAIEAIAGFAAALPAVFSKDRVYLDGADVTEAIRDEPVGNAASRIAVMAAVRTALADRQRAFRQIPGLVADGRDMGTVIFPDAALKIFLTASAQARAERRHKQLIEKGFSASLPGLLRDLEERDRRDSTRAVAPLAPAEDAQVLDSTALDVDATVERVLGLWAACKRAPQGGR